MTFKIPSQFPAIDSQAFYEGSPFDVFVLDAIAQSHNRLVACPSQMFNITNAFITRSVGTSIHPYRVAVSSLWTPVLEPFRVKKKPGTTYADFHVGFDVPAGSMKLQLTTTARPFQASPPANAINVQTLSSSVSSTVFANIPINSSAEEEIGLFVALGEGGGFVDEFLAGGPSSGTITNASTQVSTNNFGGLRIVCQYDTGIINWASTLTGAVADLATKNYICRILSPEGRVVANKRILAVGAFDDPPGNPTGSLRYLTIEPIATRDDGLGELDIFSIYDGFFDYYPRRVNEAYQAGTPYRFQLYNNEFQLDYFAGATKERSK